HAEEAEATDHRAEELGVGVGPDAAALSVRQHELELLDVLADRPDAPVVLAVDVGRRAPADGRMARAPDDGGPPPLLARVLPELPDRDARLDADPSRGRIPVEHALHPRHVERQLARGERRVAVALTGAAEADLEVLAMGDLECVGDAVQGARPEHATRSGERSPPAGELLAGRQRCARQARRLRRFGESGGETEALSRDHGFSVTEPAHK